MSRGNRERTERKDFTPSTFFQTVLYASFRKLDKAFCSRSQRRAPACWSSVVSHCLCTLFFMLAWVSSDLWTSLHSQASCKMSTHPHMEKSSAFPMPPLPGAPGAPRPPLTDVLIAKAMQTPQQCQHLSSAASILPVLCLRWEQSSRFFEGVLAIYTRSFASCWLHQKPLWWISAEPVV